MFRNNGLTDLIRNSLIIIFLSLLITACDNDSDITDQSTQTKASSENLPQSSKDKANVKSEDETSSKNNYENTTFKILDFAERNYKGASSLGIVLSVPLDPKTDFQNFFVLERRDGQRVDGSWVLADNHKELFFKNIEPETNYLLTVYANLKAINDQELGERFKQSVKTKPMEASVTFAHTGGILPLTHSKGLPIFSININHVDVEFHRVKPEKVMNFLRYWRGGKEGPYQLQQYAEMSELVYASRFDFTIEKNKRERVILPIDTIDSLKPAGIYLAVMKVPGEYDYRQAVTFFVRSDIGIHVRRYPGKLNAYLRSLVNAKPLSGIEASLLDKNGRVLETQSSDPQGLVKFSSSLKKAKLLLAKKDQQMSLVKLNQPALDLSEFAIGQRMAFQNEAFFYGPRDLYRPGETVDISLLLRDFDGQLIPQIPLQAVIKRSDDQVVERFTWQPNDIGYYHHQHQLSSTARTGRWYIEIQVPGNKTKRRWYFSVEDFLPERMKLTLGENLDEKIADPETQFVTPEQNILLPVEGLYLYGAAAAGNRLQTDITTMIDQQAIPALEGYRFGLAEEKGAYRSFTLNDVTLDEQGKTKLTIPSKWQAIKSPIAIRVTGSLFETGGRAVKRQTSFRVWPAETLIGIRPQEKEPPANTLLNFDVVNADKTGQLHAAENLQVTLIKKRRDYYWRYNSADQWEMDYSEKQYPVYHQTISIAKDDKTKLEVPVEWGYYRLEVTNPKTLLTSAVEFNAGGDWYYDTQQARIARPDKINLSLDKPSYNTGDKARLSITSSFIGQGTVLVESSEGLLWQTPITLSNSNESSLDITIDPAWTRHDLYISVVLFNSLAKPGANNKDKGKDKVKASISDEAKIVKRAIGLVHLPLDRTQRKLDLVIESQTKSKPFSQLPVTLKLKNPTQLAKQPHWVTLAAVDVGVLNVSNFQTPDAFDWFFSQRRYTVDNLDLYGNIIDGRTGIVGKQRFGGDMDMTAGGNLQKSQVKIVSLFHQPVLFNEQGEAHIDLDIPDFNGQLRLMALAFSEASFGHAEQAVTIAAPLVTQLSMPRFLAANDKSQLTLDVHNLTDEIQKINLAMGSDEFLNISESEREFDLASNAKKIIHFPITSQEQFGLSHLSLAVSHHAVKPMTKVEGTQASPSDESSQAHEEPETERFERDWQLAIRPAYPAQVRNQNKLLISGVPEIIKVKADDLIESTVQGELVISNQPPINLSEHVKKLFKYPYGCLEQSLSSTYPWLYADSANLEKLGLSNIAKQLKKVDFDKRSDYLQKGIQRLSTKQLSNGGFGLWSNQDSEEFWLTAYATEFLLQAKEQKISVPQQVLKPAVKRLQHYLRSTRPGYDYRFSHYPEHLTFAYKAYAAYVLSTIQQAPLGTIRTLYDYHQKDVKSGLPLVHLGIALIRQGDLKRGNDAIHLALSIKRDHNDYLGDYGSPLRDLSLMIEALMKFQPQHPGLIPLMSELQETIGKRKWLSTQERNALFRAGVALKQGGQKEWQAIMHSVVGEQKLIHQGAYEQLLLLEDIMQGVTLSSQTNENLYVNLNVGGYSKLPPEPYFEHFNITRTYYNKKGEMIDPKQLAVGELLIVELSLQGKNRIQDALVVDMIPAGFEIENQNLTHSIKLSEFFIGKEAIIDKVSSNDIKYQAYRDDRYVAAIDLKSYKTQRLYYLLRAVTPGTYQVPPPYAEDMYRPYIRAIGKTPEEQTILNRKI